MARTSNYCTTGLCPLCHSIAPPIPQIKSDASCTTAPLPLIPQVNTSYTTHDTLIRSPREYISYFWKSNTSYPTDFLAKSTKKPLVAQIISSKIIKYPLYHR